MDKKRVESDLPGIYMSFIRSGLMLTFLLLDPWCREVLRMFDMTKRAENCIIRLVNIRDIFLFFTNESLLRVGLIEDKYSSLNSPGFVAGQIFGS